MRYLIFLLLLFSFSFAEHSFGPSDVIMEKTWIVSCPDPGCKVEFEGILVLNDSNQQIISIVTEPEMELVEDENGEIHVIYNATMPNETITLNAVVEVKVDYDTAIERDYPVSSEEVVITNLTEPNEDISEKADELTDLSSVLKTFKNMLNWVNKNIEYDISYFGQTKNAQTVFIERRGVCVEYSHLLISMLNSQGIKTRYVNGYVISDDWQSHAWTEAYIPEYGWLPLDPTFNQIGILDSSHVMVSYGYDQSTDFDRLTANSRNAMLTRLPTKLTMLSAEEDPGGLTVEIGFENKTYAATIKLENNREDYVFATYSFYPPTGYGEKIDEVVLFEPYETIENKFQFDHSLFVEGYSYTLPLKATLNDAKDEKIVVLVKRKQESNGGEVCPLGFLLVVLGLYAIKFNS